MTTATHDEKLLLTYRKVDTVAGVTRSTAKQIARTLGLNETQMIHLAVAHLAKEVLPAYEPDNGPLTPKEQNAIRERVPQDGPFNATKSLF